MQARISQPAEKPTRGTNPNRPAYRLFRCSQAHEESGAGMWDSTDRAAVLPFTEPLVESLGGLPVAWALRGCLSLQRHFTVRIRFLSGAGIGSRQLIVSGRICRLEL